MDAVGTKICVIHKNVPSTISQFTAALGSEKINIENMINKSRKDYAYTMMDVSGEVTDKIVDKLMSVDGVIKVRVIK